MLINKGKAVLYGSLDEIRRQFASRAVVIRTLEELPASLPGVVEITQLNSATHLKLDPATSSQDLLQALVSRNIPLEKFEIALPHLDDIFIQVVKRQGETQ